MDDWMPAVAGYGFIILVLAAIAIAPNAWWARELARRYGARPSGPFGIFTRRDLTRRAALSVSSAVLCLAFASAAGFVMSRIPDFRWGNRVATTYMFGFVLLSGVGVLAALIALWEVIFYRPRKPPSPRDPREWRSLAALLDRLAIEPIPEAEWVTFASTPFDEPVLERVRVACLRSCDGDRARFRGLLRTRAQTWAAAIRSHAA
jgi:hypothetical protein